MTILCSPREARAVFFVAELVVWIIRPSPQNMTDIRAAFAFKPPRMTSGHQVMELYRIAILSQALPLLSRLDREKALVI